MMKIQAYKGERTSSKLLGKRLTKEERTTLEEMSSHHHYADFRRRALALLALDDGCTVVEICQILRVSDQPVYNWAKGWRTKGLVGILGGHDGSPPVKLTAQMLDAAADIARAQPLTLSKIAELVREQFPDAPSFSNQRLSVGLRARKLSFKRNRLSLKGKRSESEFARLQNSLELMKQAADEGEIELIYVDETGISGIPNVQRSWSPLGQPHTADASVGRSRVNVLGALNYVTQTLIFGVCDHSVRRGDTVAFLERVAQASDPSKWSFAVMDNASIHHYIDPEITLRWMIDYKFTPLYLPAYSPELNLIEILWKQAKYHWRKFVSWT